VKQSL